MVLQIIQQKAQNFLGINDGKSRPKGPGFGERKHYSMYIEATPISSHTAVVPNPATAVPFLYWFLQRQMLQWEYDKPANPLCAVTPNTAFFRFYTKET